jgi:hypothetical protein
MKDIEKQQKISTILFVIVTAIFFIAMFSGCSTTVPVTAKFPVAPERLLAKCPQLEKLGNEVKLSDISKTITVNYTTYYECAVKHDAFIEWYNIQKNIFESVK